MGYLRFHIEKMKGSKEISHAHEHNMRLGNCDNADASKSHLNRDILVREEDYQEFIKRRINELNRYGRGKQALRKDAVKGVEICIGFSHKDMEANPFLDLDRFCELTKSWMIDRFGEENIAGITLHMDEATPHIHAVIVPITSDGRLCANDVIGGPTNLREMQSELAARLEPLGLKRGMKRSVAKNEDIRKFYGAVEQAAVNTLPKPLPNETVEQYAVRANSLFNTAKAQHLRELQELTRERDEARTMVRQMSGQTDEQLWDNTQREREIASLRKRVMQSDKALSQWQSIVYCVQHDLLPQADKDRLIKLMSIAAEAGAKAKEEAKAEFEKGAKQDK